MLLFVGLGNPDPKHKNNRHNIGFMLIDALNKKFNFSKQKPKFKGLLTSGEINSHKIILVKPLTFMNNSGVCLREIQDYYKIEKKNIFVFHDDLDLELGKVRVKLGGGNAGHNGLSSIDEMIGNDYYRIRIGIDHPGEKHLVSNYVLNKFSETEIEIINKQLVNIAHNFETVLSDIGLFLTKLSESK